MKGGFIMSQPPRLTLDCFCRKCQKHFVFANYDGKCPICGQLVKDEDVMTGGGLGHEEPLSVIELRQHTEIAHL